MKWEIHLLNNGDEGDETNDNIIFKSKSDKEKKQYRVI